MPLELQIKLLRVFEDRCISPMGSNEVLDLDVRFLAASKENLLEAVEAGTFRRDFYFRLASSTLHVPPLRERREDIPRLFLQLANEASRRYRREFTDVPGHVLAELSHRDWPGNVRELRNEADRFVLGIYDNQDSEPSAKSLALRVAAHEKAIIAAELLAHSGVLKPTYEALGLSRKSLYEKMQKHDLDRLAYTKSGPKTV